jgi:hypothetical protein
MTNEQLFQLIRQIILSVTNVPEVILANQNKPAPSGVYCTVEPKKSIRERGQANIYRNDVVGDKINVDVRAQVIVEADIQFYRGDPFTETEKLNQCNKRPDISALLFQNGVGWLSASTTLDLTALQSNNFERRASKTITLSYETNNAVEINNILKVPYEFENYQDGDFETLASGVIE